ncbi:ribose 5-phosphate isomerase B [Cytophaga hutchinsonii]|jgi:ribose 5-phosphate isomerase B|uniref:Ribose 5-phosphate isomerase B n=1 Tax=Cytophaga hutchinsonii (strain ATCC 33406 / DSM 1761 / CIP 103989 / NBRC 15051 / NCIMB 9469 / D465) TaxID=269798 RepID=A0A6N4SW64_CYTH3|nr:ribose 5-phosphate isomerase B [Cytophaga hutchinsonii]ABG60864.1 ribose 5-phosphate isomerase B [Cytophaga hutchinsonii ATCC 33406]SFY00069.1 ribose 5-phosphate isomerase B [Cytophaga hutchinsonii ATCC 33406]
MAYTIALGGDHAGYTYKKEIIAYLETQGHKTIDCGPFSEASVDYPDFSHPVAEAVETGKATFGILICGSGNGVCMTANKHQHIRAGLCWTPEIAMLTRQHNNANVLCLPARFIPIEEAIACVKMFVETAFEGGRHEGRVNKIACA